MMNDASQNILALKKQVGEEKKKDPQHCLNVAITYPSVTDEGRCNYVRMTPLTP
jgi:hypothetical protein